MFLGGAGDDVLTGGGGSNSYFGGVGNDRIVADFAGQETIEGGDGIDVVTSLNQSGQVRVTFRSTAVGDGGGFDTAGDGGLNVRIQREDAAGALTGATSRADDEGTVLFAPTGAFDVRDIGGAARGDQFNHVILGTAGNDTFVGSTPGGIYYINGGAGHDRITGLLGADFLVGGAGDDVLLGAAGDDTLAGGFGADQLGGGAGADTFLVVGSESTAAGGYDTLIDFATGVDRLDVSAAAASQLSIVRSGTASFIFGAGGIGGFLVGSTAEVNGSDLVAGSGLTGNLYMLGDAAVNRLVGSAGNDTLDGGFGDDVLQGGRGADILLGGPGADRFVFTAASDSPVPAPDLLIGFQSGVDKLDLTGMRTGAADCYGYLADGRSTFLFVDLGGDGTADVLIPLLGVMNLQVSDILF